MKSIQELVAEAEAESNLDTTAKSALLEHVKNDSMSRDLAVGLHWCIKNKRFPGRPLDLSSPARQRMKRWKVYWGLQAANKGEWLETHVPTLLFKTMGSMLHLRTMRVERKKPFPQIAYEEWRYAIKAVGIAIHMLHSEALLQPVLTWSI